MADYPDSRKDGEKDGYVTNVEKVGKEEWSDLLQHFDDSSIFQTWSYGAVRWGLDNLSHLVLKKGGETVAAAQVRIVAFPLIGPCVAYVPRGPLWRRRGKKTDHEIFRCIIRALSDEYVLKRGAVLRLAPNEFENTDETLQQILEEEGYGMHDSVLPYRTILNNLTPSLEKLRKGLHKRWREKLNRAMRNGLEVEEGTDENLYETFMTLYKEMRARKQFCTGADIHEFKEIQKDLPRPLKMNIMMCTSKGRPLSALVWSAIGNTGVPIFSATGHEGLKSYGAYLLRWRMIQGLKESGCRFLDQGGIDAKLNPGGHAFKAGLGGLEVSRIGQFDAYNSKAKYCFFSCAEELRNCSRGNREKLKRLLKI